MKNSISKNRNDIVNTPYGSLRFYVKHISSGYEVAIQLYNNGLDAGEYGYGFYDKKQDALDEMHDDIKKLIEDQIDADKLLGIKNNPRYIKTIPKEIIVNNSSIFKMFNRSSYQ